MLLVAENSHFANLNCDLQLIQEYPADWSINFLTGVHCTSLLSPETELVHLVEYQQLDANIVFLGSGKPCTDWKC